MNIRDALARVLRDAGETPVQTRLTPSAVVEQVRRRRRLTVLSRAAVATAGASALVATALIVPGMLLRTDQPAPSVASGSPARSDPGTSTMLAPTSPAVTRGSGRSLPPEPPSTRPTGAPRRSTAPPSTDAGVPDRPTVTALAWNTADKREQGSATNPQPAELDDIRIGRHERFDRVVFDFADAQRLPTYEVGYLEGDQQLREPGSGRPVRVHGAATLRIVFRESTLGSLERRTRPAGLTSVEEVRYIGGFERIHEAAIGVTGAAEPGRQGFRVFFNENSVVVDVAHATR